MLTFAMGGAQLGATLTSTAYDCDLDQCVERPFHHELSALRSRLNVFSRVAGYCSATVSGKVNDWDVQALAKVLAWAATLGGVPALTASSWRAKRLSSPADVAANAPALLTVLNTFPAPAGLPAATCGTTETKPPASGSTAVSTTAPTTAYKCTTAICYSTNSPQYQKIFELIQQNLNRVGGSAGFSRLTPDGKIGNATLAAWNKTAAWLGTRGITMVAPFSSFKALADAAPQAMALLTTALAIPAASTVATAAPSGSLPPAPEGIVPIMDQAANAASSTSSKTPYYIAAVLAAGGILYAAYRWSSGPIAPRASASAPSAPSAAAGTAAMQVAGHRRSHRARRSRASAARR